MQLKKFKFKRERRSISKGTERVIALFLVFLYGGNFILRFFVTI